MPPRSSSAGMRTVRRELQRRRPVPKNKKPSAPPPRHGSSDAAVRDPPRPRTPRREVTVSHSRGSAAPASACPATPGVPAHLVPGTAVRVRTRTGTMKTGHVLVLWLRATIVSSTHGGYEVVYDGEWPRGDPKGTVHVEPRHVRLMNPPAPPATATPKKEMPRPTTAGKSLRLIRSVFPEMALQTRADLSGLGR